MGENVMILITFTGARLSVLRYGVERTIRGCDAGFVVAARAL